VICLNQTEDCHYSARFCILDDSEGVQNVFQTLTQSATKSSRHLFKCKTRFHYVLLSVKKRSVLAMTAECQ